ncbi:hypothetical protein [Sulfitobacter aestuariivivens]|uniref:Uncharacterized protein n=1 Tax=Sulfitobacter aestuariivivens TaxID=2766981 RepID=A0A927D273_9RHOB|nr:hypothetical protein [Sulfitobacter aestuariivivens]MBD3663750.1 hypothetical protein [Sulfitobacter aestuariivivens]
MSDDKKDARPDVAKDNQPQNPKGPKEKWHNPEATLGDAPASDPNAEKRSRVSD